MALVAREYAQVLDIVRRLHSCRSADEVAACAIGDLQALAGFERGALCLAAPGEPGGYEWRSVNLPPAYYGEYEALADGDFVRDAVVRRPGRVLTDEDMGVGRRDWYASAFYEHARSLSLAPEHVMAVLFAVEGPGGHGGLTLLRETKRPFGRREKELVGLVTSHVSAVLSRLAVVRAERSTRYALDAVLASRGRGVLVFEPGGRLVSRSEGGARLLENWFPGTGRYGSDELPDAVVHAVADFLKALVLERAVSPRVLRRRQREELRIAFRLLENGYPGYSCVVVGELSVAERDDLHDTVMGELTPREREAVCLALQGYDNASIGMLAGCSTNTVKKHLYHACRKLGVDGRLGLHRLLSAPHGLP